MEKTTFLELERRAAEGYDLRGAAVTGGQAALDLAGTLCAIGVSMPLIMSMLKLIGGMT